MSSYRVNEILFSSFSIIWGILVLSPEDSFSTLRNLRIFSDYLTYFPDSLFGMILILAAIPLLFRVPLVMQKACHTVLFVMWSFLIHMIILVIYPTMSIGASLVLLPYCLVALFHAGRILLLSGDLKILK